MNELTPPVAAAIAQIVKEQIEAVYEDVRHLIRHLDESLRKDVDHKLEVSRLNADLWAEQAKIKLVRLDDAFKQITEACEDMTDELLALQEQNAQLVDDYAKACSQRLTPKGGFKQGDVYHSGNVVMRDGASWWCAVDRTEADPRDKTGDWRLLSMRGATGKAGDRGQRGEPGAPGRPGKDGTSILEARCVGLQLAFAMSDGTAIHTDLEPIKDTLTALVKAEVKSALKRQGV